MAKKAELLEQATKLGLEVTEENTVPEIKAAILGKPPNEPKKPQKPQTATVLEFTGHPDNTVSVLAETSKGEKIRVEIEGKYEDFTKGQKIELK